MWLTDPFLLPSKNVSLITKISRYFYRCREQHSAGCIVYYLDDDTPKYLQFYVSQDGKSGEWWFPKGIVENEDTSLEERALKEVKEEVGLDVKIINTLRSNSYTFFWDKNKTKFKKTVHYFLAKSDSKDVQLAKYSNEKDEKDSFKEFSWSNLAQAISKTNHIAEKEILIEAEHYVEGTLIK